MKFTDGYWKVQEDVTLYQVIEAGEMQVGENSITFFAAAGQNGRKDLGGVTLTVTLSAPKENCISVKIVHYIGQKYEDTSFYQNEDCGEVSIDGENAILVSGKMKAVIKRKGQWKIDFFYDGKYVTGNGWRSTGYGVFNDGRKYIKEELNIGVGENIYGLGERFTSFIKNGQTVDIWNRDGGTSSDQAYKNIPFYLSDKGYGVLVNDSGLVSFEVASEKVERVQFSAEGESLEYCVVGGRNLQDVIKNYNRLTGMPALPPAWSFGLWLTTSFTTDYDEKTVTHFIDGMAERGIPLQVFHFDCFWMKGGHWCDFLWDRTAFPDPEGMIHRLKNRGLKICVWINPYIAQRSSIFEEGMQNGYFIQNEDGSIWQTDEWQPGMAIVDFTNPKACSWYKEHLKRLLKMGVDTFKTDFGERIPDKKVLFYNGASPAKMHNYYAYLYNKTVFELLEEEKGRGQALVFARSATCGGQQFPVHWGGDCVASYESMAETLRGGLSLTMCGFGFWSHDMGGFENCATPDLYKRWTAFGMFSTHSRLHGNSSYRVPWLFDDEAVDVLRFFTKIKCSLMPYLFGEAVKTAREGLPMMRAMVVDYPEDLTTPFLDRQYMLGDSLMVAPVFSENGEATYYLPKGKWTNFMSGEEKEAGWYREIYDYFGLPVMVKENTILPVGSEEQPVYDYTEKLCLRVYRLTDKAERKIFDVQGKEAGKASAWMENEKIHLYTEGLNACRWFLVGKGLPQRLVGGEAVIIDGGCMITPKEKECIAVYEKGGLKNGEN